jgi:hypothetical protein
MQRNLAMTKPLTSSFLSCEKDIEIILRKLFVESWPHSDELKRLLTISNKDCLDNRTNQEYKDLIESMNLKKLRDDGYIILEPRVKFKEHDDIKAYIIISFDNFTPNGTNPEYRDCTVNFDILCHTDCWDIGNYRMRPLKIAGYIDGILNGTHLSGIGKFLFMGCSELILNENLSGYTLSYWAVHNAEEERNEE